MSEGFIFVCVKIEWTEMPKEEEDKDNEKELNGAVEKLKITDMDENTKGIPKVTNTEV